MADALKSVSGYSEEEKAAFAREVDLGHRANRFFDYTLVCAHCNFTMKQSEARMRGLTNCPMCGGREVRVQTLPYEQGIRENPLPTPQEAERQSRAQMPGRPR